MLGFVPILPSWPEYRSLSSIISAYCPPLLCPATTKFLSLEMEPVSPQGESYSGLDDALLEGASLYL
jgi:hypothetical protein